MPPACREALRLIDLWLESQQVYRQVPALSAAVVQGDRVVWSKGYGTLDSEHGIPATAQTLYSICSISKLFTSVALMQLWEAGRVRLDEAVTTYLPWAKLSPLHEDSAPITLRAVLTHSAGLPRESDFPYWTGPDFSSPTETQLRAKLAEQTPLWPPSRWLQYSNLGFALLGDIISAVSGEPYNDYVQSHILSPLHLKDTRPFMPMALYNRRLAAGWGAITRDGTRELLNPFEPRALTPATGYTSTVDDLGLFAAWQFRVLCTNESEVLMASTLREMQRVQFIDPVSNEMRGLGFEVVRKGEQSYLRHHGDCPGYRSILLLRPTTETAVVLITTGERPGTYAFGVFDILDKRQAGKSQAPAGPGDVDLESYAGRYAAQPWHSEVVVVPWDGGLVVLWIPTANPAEDVDILRPKGGDLFRRVRSDGSEADEVRFERDPSGRVCRFVQFSNPHERLAGIPSEPP
jgi:CubicO group peptidase (beta-lactamase class C family)